MECEQTEIFYDGTKVWLNDVGVYHREDGPAVEWWHGGKDWYVNGVKHRLDGPATINRIGNKIWFINGFDVNNKITKWAKERDIDLDNLSEEDKMIIQLEWGNYGG